MFQFPFCMRVQSSRSRLGSLALAFIVLLSIQLFSQPSHADAWQPKGEVILYPKSREVAEGSSLPLRLKPICKYSCPDDEISLRLEDAASVIVWRVNGIEGGNPEVGTIEQTVTDNDGRMTSVTYVAPKQIRKEMTVDVSATVTRKGGKGQVTYVSHLTILDAGSWSGWVQVSFKGMLDVYGTGAADRNWDTDIPKSDERRPYTSTSLDMIQTDISWLEVDIHHTITDALSESGDDSGLHVTLTGSVSGEALYINRQQQVGCTVWSRTDMSGEIIDYGPMMRMINFTTAPRNKGGSTSRRRPALDGTPAIMFEMTGKTLAKMCADEGLIIDEPPETEGFGFIPVQIEGSASQKSDACDESFATTFDDAVRFRGRSIPGQTTVSWCLNRN